MRRRPTVVLVAAVLVTASAGIAGARPSAGLKAVRVGHRVEFVRTHPKLGVKPLEARRSKTSTTVLTLHSAATPGPVSPNPRVYLVFWGSQWSSDPAGAAPALQAFFQGLYGSADTWGTVMSQYCEGLPVGTSNCGSGGIHIVHPTSTPLAGVWFDNAAAAPSKSTTAQIAAEAAAAAAHFGNTTQASNTNAQYVIASATGTHPDGFPKGGFCAWHSSASTASGTIAYTNLPYVPDLGVGGCTTIANPTPLDGYFSTETHEYNESVTDLWPSLGWLTKSGAEGADLCVSLDARLTLSTGTFDVQGVWSNSANACVTHG